MTFIESELFHDKRANWPFTKGFTSILLKQSRDDIY
jgi:hypothetical protein